MPQLPSNSVFISFSENPKLQLDLLQTVLVRASDQEGNTELHRALLDSGAQHSIIAMSQFPTLRLEKRRLANPFVFNGVSADGRTEVTQRVTLKIHPSQHTNNQSMIIHPICFPRNTPWSMSVPPEINHHLFQYKGLLADPDLLQDESTLPFSIILSNYDSHCLLSGGKQNLNPTLYTRETPFGLVVGGRRPLHEEKNALLSTFLANNDEEDSLIVTLNKAYNDQQLTKEITEYYRRDRIDIFGDPSENLACSPDEFLKEYYSSLSRLPDGRVVAPLPKQANFTKVLSNNHRTGERRIKSVVRLLERGD
jgi:hypothetical protein